uniref:(northern house mosquito) hypothetical protein n=1 Tax=Culex pipiens TaxID=7175 RepID=A0A8D8NXS3_CULPI
MASRVLPIDGSFVLTIRWAPMLPKVYTLDSPKRLLLLLFLCSPFIGVSGEVPTVVYRTKVSLFSSIASTASFSQYWAVMMAIVGCLLDAIVGICLTILISLSSWWIRVNELYSMDLMRPRSLSSSMICSTSSSSQPLSLDKSSGVIGLG